MRTNFNKGQDIKYCGKNAKIKEVHLNTSYLNPQTFYTVEYTSDNGYRTIARMVTEDTITKRK